MTERTERVAHGRWVERSGRFGLATKGFSYMLVAIIALKVAVDGGQAEDRHGALKSLADEPFGWALLAMVALGFAAYALWRFVTAIFDRGGEGEDAKGIGKRLADFAKGVLYGGLAVATAAVLVGASDGGGANEEDKATAVVLGWPAGRWLVAAGGLAFIGAGAFNAYRALSGSFREELRTELMGGVEEGWYTTLGVAGHLARAVVFALIGIFLVRAAWQYDPDEAAGLDETLQTLAGEAYGPFLLAAVALGLAAYGLFSVVQARYRDV